MKVKQFVLPALMILGVVNLTFAQSFQDVNYNFSPAGPSFSNTDFDLIRTAANGYGIWSLKGSLGEYRWVLLSNQVNIVDLSNPDKIVPDGVVQSGNFILDSYIKGTAKIATNLRGCVRYVWINQAKTGFMVQGFGDGQVGSAQIDVKFNGLPNPAPNRYLIDPSSQITQYPTIEPFGSNVPLGLESPGFDQIRVQYDIAMDAKNLYIVWNKVIPDDPNWEIWAVTIDLATGNHTGVTFIDYGRRPTVAADVRNHPESYTYDVACVVAGVNYSTPGLFQGVRTRLMHESNLQIRIDLQNVEERCDGIAYSYDDVTFARILCGSVAASPTPAKGVYFTRRSHEDHFKYNELLFHRIHYDNTNHSNAPLVKANLVDGTLMGLEPAPLFGMWGVIEEPIVAFANPYDGNNSSEYNEFHCAYSMRDVNNPNQGSLLLVRADHNGCSGRPDTRTPVDRHKPASMWEWVNPNSGASEYSACVNQMGIHAFRGVDQSVAQELLYHARDKRSFDEPIEENTLLSYDCYVKDGTTHSGSVGATVQAGRTVTLWTDPISDVTSTSDGLYINTNLHGRSWHNAQLRFVDANAEFTVGPHGGNGATFVTFPNCEIHFFEGFPTKNQMLVFNRKSIWEYYGIPAKTDESDRNETASIFFGIGRIKFNSVVILPDYFPYEPPYQLVSEPTLNIHGGANFSTSTYVSFEAEGSTINVLNEPSVLPAGMLVPPFQNAATSGTLSFSGNATLLQCFVQSNINVSENFEYLVVRPQFKASQTVTGDQFISRWSKFENTGLGNAVIRFRDNYSASQHYRSSIVQAGRMISNEVYFENPFNDIEVELVTFDQIRRNGIQGWSHAVLNPDPIPGNYLYSHNYQKITIDNCRFEDFENDNTAGIHLLGFEKNEAFEDVRVQNNWFITAQLQGISVRAAIDLEATSATVLRNWAGAYGFKDMLINRGTEELASNSFICDNTLRFASNSGDGAGLTTQYWSGYAKLNRSGFNEIGHKSQEGDQSGILFSRYHDNPETGLLMTHLSTNINLSGIHSGSNNYAAFDTLDGNNTNVGNTIRSGQIFMDNSALAIGTSSNSPSTYSTFGQNTFIVPLSGMRFIVNGGSSTVSIGGVNQNFWGQGTLSSFTAYTGTSIASTPSTYFGNVSISYDGTEPAVATSPIGRPFTVSCGQGFETETSPPAQDELLDRDVPSTDDSDCKALYGRLSQMVLQKQYQMVWDTGRFYIENCANTPESFRGFYSIRPGAQFRSDSLGRWNELREWVKEVLYLNTTDPYYYCAGVNLLFMSFNHVGDKGKDYEGMIALYDYIISSGRCPDDTSGYIEGRRRTREIQYKIWADSVKDSLATPFDTTKVTLEELGLEWVKNQSAVRSAPQVTGVGLISFVARENPYRRETELEYELDSDVRVNIEVFDVLGRRLLGDDIGLLAPKGRHSLRLPDDLPSGVLMARISTGAGAIKTIQLRKIE